METTLNVWKQICDSDILGRTPHNVYCEWKNSLHQNFVLDKKNTCHEISSLIKYNMYHSEKLGWKPWNNMLQKQITNEIAGDISEFYGEKCHLIVSHEMLGII